jgi:hypothetical protein
VSAVSACSDSVSPPSSSAARQSARLTAITLAIVQAGFGVGFIAQGSPLGLALIPLAGLVVIPLSTESAEQFFEARPEIGP